MNYGLVVTTDGRPGVLERTLAAFDARVRPRPESALIVDDSGDPAYHRYLESIVDDRPGWTALFHRGRQGFCRTVADAWIRAAHFDAPWVLWLEDDFEFVRSVDLRDLAYVLEREPQVAQMAFYRNPVSPEEVAAGGYLNLRRDTYALRGAGSGRTWFEHRNHWTTNPSLFKRGIADRHPWPGFLDQCEGRFGLILRGARPTTTFGLWGAGDPWVLHHGERSGSGY